MGMSDWRRFLSDKDLKSMEFNSLSKPTSEYQDHECPQTGPSEVVGELQEQKREQEEEEEEKGKIILVSSLTIKTPSLGEVKVDEEDDGGFRTPTSLDQRIPLITQCPPAPRKPKQTTLPPSSSSAKRKAASRRILLDLSSEVESLFPASLVADLGDGKIKKVRRVNGTK